MKERSVEKLLVLLVLSLLVDIIGMLSYVLPVIGEVIDVPWAPLSALIVHKLYPELPPSVPIFNFIEEILPFTDIIPTATLCWIYVVYNQVTKNAKKGKEI